MFSNTFEYAVESAIESFNAWIQSLDSYIHYTDVDFRNGFIQRYRKHTKSVSGVPNIDIKFDNIMFFKIHNNVLAELRFCKSRRWNCIGEEYVNLLNEIISKLDLKEIGNRKLICFDIEETFDKSIASINNYKIIK